MVYSGVYCENRSPFDTQQYNCSAKGGKYKNINSLHKNLMEITA